MIFLLKGQYEPVKEPMCDMNIDGENILLDPMEPFWRRALTKVLFIKDTIKNLYNFHDEIVLSKLLRKQYNNNTREYNTKQSSTLHPCLS